MPIGDNLLGMKTLTLALASLVSLLPPVAYADSEGFGSLTPQQVAAKLKQKNVYVLDNKSVGLRGEGASRDGQRRLEFCKM